MTRIGTGYNILLASQYMAQNRLAYARALEPLSSGKKINHLHDDPAHLSEYFQSTSKLSRIEQYTTNISTAETRINITDSTLSEINELNNEAYELALQGNDQTLTADERIAITDRLSEIKEDITSLCNTKFGDSYIFAGYKSSTIPFSGDPVAFAGDSNQIMMKVSDTKEVQTTIDADITFTGSGGGVDVFATIDSLIIAIQANDATTIGNNITDLQTSQTQISNARAVLGNASKSLDTATNILGNLSIQISERIAALSDVDIASATTNLSFCEFTLQSALAVASRVMEIQLQSFFS